MSGRWYSTTPTTTTATVEFWPSAQTTTSTFIELPAPPKLELVPDLPRQRYQGPMPPRTSAFVKARHGFQQMCRLPCYRGRRTR